jgi:hypothetical protein
MVKDIHFFGGYPLFGLGAAVDKGSQIPQNIPSKCG